MATLVLSSAGSAIGGPIGGAIGTFVGQRIDTALFALRREGPRLETLAVQSSRYGTPLPLLFGRTRTAGTVIWATDLTERRSRSGGKSTPKVTTYSYFADFAVALSARPIIGIGRIWADGTLLTRADGTLSVDGRMRVHRGGENQLPDPLIAAEEGRRRTPAYRGLAYVVFEELALESFGNRVPLLSFEVISDEGPVPVGTLVEALSGGAIGADTRTDAPTDAVVGAAIGGGRRRDALDSLAEPLALELFERAARTVLRGAEAVVPLTLAPDLLGARRAEDEPVPPIATADRPAITSVALEFAEPARDYQAGRQRASAGGADARPAERELPLVLDAATAKALATRWLDRAQGAARRVTVTLPSSGLVIAPGDELIVPGAPGRWRVVDWLWERMVVRLELEPVVGGAALDLASDGGRIIPARPALSDRASRVALLDLPYLVAADAPRLYVAVGRDDGSDRPLPLLVERAGVTEPVGLSTPAAVTGVVVRPPAAAGPLVLDLANSLEVVLDGVDDLSDADALSLATDANAAWVGGEILQWGRAEPLGQRRWRLSRLLRGRRGTEARIGDASPGALFVLLEPATLQPLPAGPPGGRVRVSAVSAGEGSAPILSDTVVEPPGAPPLPPVHLSARRRPDGGLDLAWTRCSRSGWAWTDGTDAPLAEEREAYWIEGAAVALEIAEPRLTLPPTLAPANPSLLTVRQIGTHGRSDPSRFSISRSPA